MMPGPRNFVNIRVGARWTHFEVTGLGDRAKVEIWDFGNLFASVENTHVVF